MLYLVSLFAGQRFALLAISRTSSIAAPTSSAAGSAVAVVIVIIIIVGIVNGAGIAGCAAGGRWLRRTGALLFKCSCKQMKQEPLITIPFMLACLTKRAL